MKKIFCIFSEALIFVILVYLLIINYLANSSSEIKLIFSSNPITISTSLLIAFIFVLCIFLFLFVLISVTSDFKQKISSYEKRTEKLSVQNETNSDSREALERKIATLEIALENALKKNK